MVETSRVKVLNVTYSKQFVLNDGQLVLPLPETANEDLADKSFDQTIPISPLYNKERSVSQIQQNDV